MTITKITKASSPNHDARTLPVSLLVLHYTGMDTGAAAVQRLCDPAARVSAHYVVGEDGHVLALVDEGRRAWHAGRSCWRGIHDVNSASIGIEIVNGGHDHGLPAYPDVQMRALIVLCRGILGRHPIAARDIVGHSDIAPERKQDPGEHFDWHRLARAGIGLWPQQAPAAPAQASLAEDLARIGYCPGADRGSVITAFQRRYLPDAITGSACPRTRALAHSLAAMAASP